MKIRRQNNMLALRVVAGQMLAMLFLATAGSVSATLTQAVTEIAIAAYSISTALAFTSITTISNNYYNENIDGNIYYNHLKSSNNNNHMEKNEKKEKNHYNSSSMSGMDENITSTSATSAATTIMPTETTKNNNDFNNNNNDIYNNNNNKNGNNEEINFIDGDIGSDVDVYIDMDPAAVYVPPSQRPETYIITVLFTLIFIVGVLGNGTLVIIFFRHRSMRNIPNTYILSLALADLLVIVVCVPMATIVYTQESWTFGVDLCRISEFFKDISIGVSVFTLTALSGERYCAIVNPLRKLQTKPLTVLTAILIWILAIFLGTPSFVISDIDEVFIESRNFTILVCTPFGKNGTNTETYAKYTVISKACIYYLLPLSIIGALYILMARRLHMSAREMPGEALGMQSRSQARARRHVARMVVTFVVVFFACFFPYHLFELWFHLNPTAFEDFDDFWHAIRIIGFCTSFLHSCVNPVTLYCISGVFRQHFNRYLCCLCVKKQPRLRQHSTATAMMDTSIMSIRRSNTATNYNRASLYITNSTLGGGSGGGRGGIGGKSFNRQISSQLQRGSVVCGNNNIGSSSGNANNIGIGMSNNGPATGVGGCGSGGSGGVSNRNSTNKAGISPAQSIVLSDKR